MPEFDQEILKFIICPKSGKKLFLNKKNQTLFTEDKKNVYKIVNGIPILK